MVYRTKLFIQMVITVIIEEHLSTLTQFCKPLKLIGLDIGLDGRVDMCGLRMKMSEYLFLWAGASYCGLMRAIWGCCLLN